MNQSNLVYIDEDRVAALARALDDAAPGAETLGRQVDDAVSEAADLGAPIFPAFFSGIPFLGGMGPGGKLIDVGKDAPDTAAEIRRRLEFLAACERLRDAGFVVDRSLVFEDDEPPRWEEIEELASMFREFGPDVVLANEDVSAYGAAEIDAAIASLSDEELRAMNEGLGYLSLPHGGRVPHMLVVSQAEVTSWLFANVSAVQMERLHQQVPRLEPTRPDEDGTGWREVDIDLANEDFSYQDIDQGGLRTCWFLASVGAVGATDSDFLRDNIRQNPNGSYTVTLYQDGEPVDVTVSNFIPDPPYARPAWVAIYEKAAAQLYADGNYEGLEDDQPFRALELITGQAADYADSLPGLDEIEQRLDAGQPVVAHTPSESGWDDKDIDGDVVADHTYMVMDVTTNADGERVIHLRNPWGPGTSDRLRDLYLTEEEFHDAFVRLHYVPAPG